MRDRQCDKNGIWIAVKRHKVAAVVFGIPLAVVLLVVLLIGGIILKFYVINPTYWPYQEKTVYSFQNKDDDPNGGGVAVAVCDDSSEVLVAIYDDKGRQIDSPRGPGQNQVTVPPQTTYRFVAKNVTGRWVRANVHECDIYS